MAKLDILLITLGVGIFALGAWLAKTPFDYFVTITLSVLAPFSVASWVSSGIEVADVKADIGKVRESFGGMLK